MAEWSILKDEPELKCSENRECDYFNNDSLSDSNNDVKWEDCDDKFRCLFDQILMVLHRGMYAKNGIRPIPPLLGDGQSVDLFKLFCLVRDRGGFSLISKEKLWGLVAEKFGFSYKLCAPLKLIYFKYLDELDSWLNRITRDRVSSNGSYECGGNLGLLSLEFERRFRDFSTHGKEMINKDEDIGYDKLCERYDVDPRIPNCERDKLYRSVVKAVVDDDEKLCKNKEFLSKAKQCVVDKDNTSRKRKREVLAGMRGWMIMAAKNPCHPSIGTMPSFSKWKENDARDFWSISLMVRESRLRRQYCDSTNEHSPAHQKQKMHPSLYEDDPLASHRSTGGLRCSERLSSIVKTSPCPCCKPRSDDQDKLADMCKPPPETSSLEQEHEPDSPGTKNTVGQYGDDPPFEKHVSIGPRFQAEVPVWTGFASQSDPKWLGTQIWTLDNSCTELEFQVMKGRADFCSCQWPGSVECYRFHIAEQRMKLRRELGLVFFHWKFDRMGEEVSLSWSIEEEKRFKQIIKLNKPLLGKSFFPKKTWTNLVSYYYNVFLISRRSYQNRVTPNDIDSDDDEAEFGSVGDTFGYNAMKALRAEPLICYENKQVNDY